MLTRSDDIADILEACLERLRHGESVQACLRDYPAEAPELAALLSVAMRVSLLPPPELAPAARKAIQRRLRHAVAAQQSAQRPSRPRWWVHMALRVACVVLLLMTIGLGGGVAAAQSSLPGSPLYPLKRVGERAQLMIATRPEQRAALHLDFAGARAVEIVAMANIQRPLDGAVIDDLAQEYELAWAEIERSPAGAGEALRKRYVASSRADVVVLTAARAHAPAAYGSLLATAVQVGQQALGRAASAEPELPPLLSATPEPRPQITATPELPAAAPKPPAEQKPTAERPRENGPGEGHGGNNGNHNGGANTGNGGTNNGNQNGQGNDANNGQQNGQGNGTNNGNQNSQGNGANNGNQNGQGNPDNDGKNNGNQNGQGNEANNGNQNGQENGANNGNQNGQENGANNGQENGANNGNGANQGGNSDGGNQNEQEVAPAPQPPPGTANDAKNPPEQGPNTPGQSGGKGDGKKDNKK